MRNVLGSHTRRFVIFGSILTLTATLACADPFDWDVATRTEGVLVFETQPAVRFILGYSTPGYTLDYSVVLMGEQDIVLIEKATSQGVPRIQAMGDMIVVESFFEPWGQEGTITHRQCWSFDPQHLGWQEGLCPQ